MITKRNSLLIIVLTICVSNLGFASNRLIKSIIQRDENDPIPLKYLARIEKDAVVDRITSPFGNIFGPISQDVKNKQTQIRQLRTSLMPWMYRIAATIFAITAGVNTIDSLLIAANASQGARDSLHKYSYANRFPFRTANYLADKLSNMAQKIVPFDQPGFSMAIATIINSKPILGASIISAFFLKLANSYEEKAQELTKSIDDLEIIYHE